MKHKSLYDFKALRLSMLVSGFSLMLVTTSSNGQPGATHEDYLDFWQGTWDLTWEDPDGTIAVGRNIITREYDGFVVYEKFSAISGTLEGFQGMSVSVYDPTRNIWKQTWVDNQGSYLDFEGAFDGEKRIFVRRFTTPGGMEMIQRMVFSNISEDSFMWDWESSTDEGSTWNLNWRIQYTRHK